MAAIDTDLAVSPASATEPRWYPYALIAPAMITFVLVALVPFLFAVFISFHQMKYGRLGDFAGFENYGALLSDSRFWNSMAIAALFVAIAVPLEFMLGLAGALMLCRPIWGRSALVPLLFIPTTMAPIVVGLLWKIMLAGSWGLLSTNVIEPLGLVGEISIFASPDLALYALIFVDVWQWTPFMMLAFFAGLQALPVNPYRAAAVDGATPVQAFFRLTLPMMAPLLVVIGLLRLIDAFKVFDSIFILTGGGPGTSTEMPSVLAYKMTFEFWNIGEASALAVVVWLLFFAFCNVFYQLAKKKLNAF
ncbi:carbohydrate ABC transporter membrane protein 1, CUT1 family [Tistlia consotensis]|uniref:Carbohydrate ABC transporter membrane protein 1, CUT1 family n=1 Tax=Tistlia consotensis USBA 355 TaxID=560819 RepID=A0A1Y6C069_9PROT|nr:sugar ABC transporter permease [Tistlia consotensis]SMF37393.1 carbohydrate ABC transporter membrane protein 1, CUT1 family [Tistlia consotensis USBA 355]SNR72741.1 carbohydrate ABC transporter membrane protein 1, CUT1 family [Tistlia consotensis]